jgi:hypothetical protein
MWWSSSQILIQVRDQLSMILEWSLVNYVMDMKKVIQQIIKSPDIGPITNNPGAVYKSSPLSHKTDVQEFKIIT